jgi:hypothetical protein
MFGLGKLFGNHKEEETTGAPGVYEVGSPEYNAQIIAALRQVNEQLAPQGKRVPERAAIHIIMDEMPSIHTRESED